MRSVRPCLILCLALTLLVSASKGDRVSDTADQIRIRVEASHQRNEIRAGNTRTYAVEILRQFYESRVFAPAWVGSSENQDPVDALIAAIRDVDKDGLTPADYHLESIREKLDRVRSSRDPSPRDLADLDFLLTDTFFVLSRHLEAGRVDPVFLDSEWHVETDRRSDMIRELETVLTSKQVRSSLAQRRPSQKGYRALRDALARYRRIDADGGWVSISPGPKLESGALDGRVPLLRARLVMTADLAPGHWEAATLFDESLSKAIRRFQARHGLAVDGVVGAKTLEALNVPAKKRAEQLALNLERWRWLPDDLGDRYLLVNIPSFELWVVENNDRVQTHRVVVGKPFRRTPVFSSTMTYLVLSPFWHVPPTITAKDVLPEIRKSLDYLSSKNIRVFRGWGGDAVEVDPSTVDWAAISPKNNPFRFRQDPGPLNALGGVKFMFPNPFDVYMHDTPVRELFDRPDRSFSSGCIRVQDPLVLAEYLLRDPVRWSQQSLREAIERKTEQTVRLPAPINVHLLYWTAWVEPDGSIQFRQDIYDRDDPLRQALHEKPPVSGP